MQTYKKLDLELENKNYLHLNEEYLKPYKEQIEEFLEEQDNMKSLSFAKKVMMSQEIKANNMIEGINDDLSIIDEVIKKKSSLSKEERKRIINLYHGYRYILNNKNINKESLKELYSILSDDLLDTYSKTNMGEYYRKKPVYILRGINLEKEPFMGMESNKIDYYMNQFFSFANNDSFENSEVDSFIKSQIMHYYFVYIHPYFDVNGRTSRTVSMWYLLNKEKYPYIIFNRAIAYSKKNYEPSIIKTRETGNITLFLKYMLENVLKELEKEYVIHNIKENTALNKEEIQMLEYFLTINGNKTVTDLATIYNSFNDKKRKNKIYHEQIKPLIEKNILVNDGYTKGYIDSNNHNMNIKINKDTIDIKKEKIKLLKIDNYLN